MAISNINLYVNSKVSDCLPSCTIDCVLWPQHLELIQAKKQIKWMYMRIWSTLLHNHRVLCYLSLTLLAEVGDVPKKKRHSYCSIYRRFGELLFFEMAFITSSCNVDGGSDRISVDVDKWRSLSETAALEIHQNTQQQNNWDFLFIFFSLLTGRPKKGQQNFY